MEVTKLKSGGLSGNVYCADAIEMLKAVGKEKADIIFLDPPFNLGKTYYGLENMDNKPPDEYAEWLIDIIDRSINTLKPGGALFVYHLPIWAIRIGAYAEKHLLFRHWISVSMKNGFARGSKLYPAHYALLYLTKGAPKHFTRPKLEPLRCRFCGSFVRDYGGYKKIIENSGVNLSDIWDDLSPVRHKNLKYRVANELPLKLFDRIISISGAPGMTYVDPFAGSGSGAIAAFDNSLHFEVGDLIRDNTNIIIERVTESRLGVGDNDA